MYSEITDKIIGSLDKNIIPWNRPFISQGMPKNLMTKKPYRGINSIFLSLIGEEYFLTYKQAELLGGHIKRGAHGIPIIFWKFIDVEDKETGDIETVPMLKYYTVFAASDAEGVEVPVYQNPLNAFNPIEEAEKIISNMPNMPEIEFDHIKACYSKTNDKVYMPSKELFISEEEYYSTLFHELAHSTGSERRLNRKSLVDFSLFGSDVYSIEELIAEIAGAFLCAAAGIAPKTIENQASYIRGWLNALKGDAKMIIQAAGKAQKAADYILNRIAEPEPEGE